MFVDPNRLLFIISSHGSMTWAQYCEAVDFLSTASPERYSITDGTATRSGILQCLEALGHCNAHYSQGKSTITITPPALCRLPRAGLPIAVLTGARCVQTKEEIVKAAQESKETIQSITESHRGSLGLLPDTILIKSESEIAMKSFCENLKILCADIPPAWTLVNWCGTISEYEATLDYRISETLNWARFDFNVKSHKFVRDISDSFPRYSRYLNPITALPSHVIFRDGLGAEVDLSWGRYLLLMLKGITVTAYDENRFRLCVPVKTPLPTIVARTVCLCSGKPPVHWSKAPLLKDLNCQDWLLYEDVPPQIAFAALSKVGQSPIIINIR